MRLCAQSDFFRNLCTFDISNSAIFTPQLVSMLESNAQRLIIKRFVMNRCTSDALNTSLQSFFKGNFFKKIQQIEVAETEIDDTSLVTLIQNGASLTLLNMDRCANITQKGLHQMCQGSKILKQLQVINLNYLLNGSSQEEKRINNSNFKSESSSLINFLTGVQFFNLKELYLDNTKVEAHTLTEITGSWNLKALELISLRNCKNLTSYGLYKLHLIEDMKELQKVYLDGNKIEIKVEVRRLLKTNIKKAYQTVSFLGCQILNSEQLLRYLTSPMIQEQIRCLGIEYDLLNDQVATFIRNQTKINQLIVNVDSSLLLSSIIENIITVASNNSAINVELQSRILSPSVLKHVFVQEIQLKNLQSRDLNVCIDSQKFKDIIQEIEAPRFMDPIKLLQLPTPSTQDESYDKDIFDDLKKLVNSVKFLNISNLNLSSFILSSEIINLLCTS